MDTSHFSTLEWIYVALGTLGLLLALLWVTTRKPKAPRLPQAPSDTAPTATPTSEPTPIAAAPAPAAVPAKSRWWMALTKSREKFLLRFNGDLQSLKDSMEEACLASDLGVSNTQEALDLITWSEISSLPEGERVGAAKQRLSALFENWVAKSDGLAAEEAAWPVRHDPNEPTVIWFVGVNGTGKTTSIAKLTSELKRRGHTVLLGAGDTFRAAAGEQLETWAQRLEVPIVKGQEGADASAVLFDAIQSGIAKKVDFVICDSAGRLHNQGQLMEALSKNKRVMNKALPGAPHEVLLTLDANTGQNMLNQAEQFRAAVGVTGLVLTKLDGTARGGAVVAVARKTGLPIRRLGLGETPEDFVSFDARRFTAALMGTETLA